MKDKKQPLVRLDAADKEILDSLSEQTGESSPKVLHKALSRYKKEMFFERLNRGYSNLKESPENWAIEQADRKLFESSIGDGIDGLA